MGNRGGRREGAGRKRLNRTHMHIYVERDVYEFLRIKAKAEERPMGEIIEEYILIAETDEGIEPRGY